MAASERGCCVPRCGKTRKNETILHSFPNPEKDKNRYLAWIQAIGNSVSSLDPEYVYKNRRVCHAHFEMKDLTWTRRLSSGAVPTLFLPGSEMTRQPLIEISENVFVDAAIPSTSRGERSTQTAEKQIQATIKTDKVAKKYTMDQKELLKTVRTLKKQKDSYATRLNKALKLSENKTFQKMLNKFTSLAATFTLMQFREIGKNKMGHRFTESEKIMALSLYKRSPRTYRWLQKVFVLPTATTLTRLISQANLNAGMNQNLFHQLKKRVKKMNSDDKLCTLLFDEMSLAPHFDYNQKKDEISGFVNSGKSRQKKIANHALVFMIRGVQKNYKQPVCYTFCSGTTNSNELACLIKDVIRKLHNIGLRVLATICDQGTTNVSAINLLIKETKTKYVRKNEELYSEIFEVDDEVVIPLYDPPHLIKGIRNNLLSKNLICSINGSIKIAKWEHIVKLYNEDPAYKGIKLVNKLTDCHINPDKFQKMKVKYATQVLSRKVAITMGFLAEKNILPAECTQTADTILFFDDLFDSLNGSFQNANKRSGKTLLQAVTPKSDHGTVWSNAKTVLQTMKFINKDGITQVTVPTINNLLQSIKNVDYLTKVLFEKYKIRSVWMRHLNQDPLENFFGSIRSHGCRNINPTVAGFESSFAALLINNLSGQHSPGSNCEEDSCQVIFKSMGCLFQNTVRDRHPTENIDIDFNEINYDFETKKNNPRLIASLQYVTGYVLRKTKNKIFKNCTKCRDCFYDPNNTSEFLKSREYCKGKSFLTYPKNEFVIFFSQIQDIITHILKKDPSRINLKIYLKTILYTMLDFLLFDCEKHKSTTIDYMLELSCIFFYL
uniref:THAP-type domain-containing protein n=1 Tax=Heliothis virescens TaxID=7102 RepID=A0A2A4JPP6_HELVI